MASTSTQPRTETKQAPKQAPLYHVVLLDDDDHTYDYVVEMLICVFRYSPEKSYRLACDVDAHGRVVVDTCMLERAELKRDQILGYGADWRIPRCRGSMTAVLERARE